ncbi:MAG: hypothetical protein R3D58_14235 [Saprospiraceae bacterium]
MKLLKEMRHAPLFFLLFVLLMPESGTAQMSAAQNTAARPFRLVVIGSSTAAGAGAKPVSNAWVKRYERYLKSIFPPTRSSTWPNAAQSFHLLPTGFQPPEKRPAPDYLAQYFPGAGPASGCHLVTLPSTTWLRETRSKELLENFDVLTNTAREAVSIPVWFSTTQPRNFGPEK